MNKHGVITEKTQESHLAILDIIKYLEKPDSPQFLTIRHHLLNCTQCLQQVHKLSQLEQQLVIETSPALAPHNLRSPELAKYRPSLYLILVKKIRHLSDPVWCKLNTSQPIWKPVAAFAGITALYFGLIGMDFKSSMSHSTQHLVAYQDSGNLEYTQKRNIPGIGFSSGIMIEKTPFQMPIIHWNNKTLTLSWEKIADIEEYTLEIFSLSDEKKRIIAYLKSNASHISFKNIELITHRRYLYVISGNTISNKNFKTSGGFVISDSK